MFRIWDLKWMPEFYAKADRPLPIEENNVKHIISVEYKDLLIEKNTTFNVCKLNIQNKEYYFRECKKHVKFEEYLRNLINEYVDSLEDNNPLKLEFLKVRNTLMKPDVMRKLFRMGIVNDRSSKISYFFKSNDISIWGIQELTELVHTVDCGQVSINISKPGITKGQHWHNSKWEQFIVVHGHGLIQERNINTGETVEFEVSGDKIEAIYMIPGWTHNIINLSETDDLVTVMTCNEIFDPGHPDTFFEPV